MSVFAHESTHGRSFPCRTAPDNRWVTGKGVTGLRYSHTGKGVTGLGYSHTGNGVTGLGYSHTGKGVGLRVLTHSTAPNITTRRYYGHHQVSCGQAG